MHNCAAIISITPCIIYWAFAPSFYCIYRHTAGDDATPVVTPSECKQTWSTDQQQNNHMQWWIYKINSQRICQFDCPSSPLPSLASDNPFVFSPSSSMPFLTVFLSSLVLGITRTICELCIAVWVGLIAHFRRKNENGFILRDFIVRKHKTRKHIIIPK